VAVHVRQQPEILLPDRLARRRELGGGAERGRLRLLAARVRVHLGIEDQDVDVAPVGQHMIEAAVADVVRPPVAADEPDALLHEIVGERFQPPRLGGFLSRQLAPKRQHTVTLGRDAGFGRLIRIEQRSCQTVADLRREMLKQAAGGGDVRVEREAEAEPELRVVLEEGVRPGRPPAVTVRRVRRRRQVAAVNRRAAGGVRNEEPVAEELGEQLQVRRLAAARARSRVLEQRLEEL